jgi:ribonuclease HI
MTPIQSCEIYIDGASHGNPGPAGVGVVFVDSRTKPVRQFSKYIGETTNNVAEYLALIYALQEALKEGRTKLTIKTDSELLARQVNGQYRVRDAQLRLFHDLALHLAQAFRRCSVEHIPRTQNTLADRLAGQAVSGRGTKDEGISGAS